MRGRSLVAGLAVAAALALSAPATAQPRFDHVIRCGNGPSTCVGTKGDDKILGGHGPDILRGLGGNDALWTGKGGPGDRAYGGPGNDRLFNYGSGNSGGYLNGGHGWDVCVVNRRAYRDGKDIVRNCEVVKFRGPNGG